MAAKNFTFIGGGDDFLVSRLSKEVFEEKAQGLSDDFSREVINGMASKVEEVETALNEFRASVQTLSLFGDRKAVWLKDVNFLADSQTGKAEGTLRQVELLKEILSAIDPAGVDVLISAYPIDRRRSFVKWCEKNSDFRLVGGDKKSANMIYSLIAQECERLKISIDQNASDLLIAKVSGNTRLVVTELEKIATFLGDESSRIEENHVAELVPDFGAGDFFETAEAFASGDLAWTLDAIRRHFFTNDESRPLISSLQGRNRLMIQLRVLIDAGEIRVSDDRGLARGALDHAASVHKHHFGDSDNKSAFNIFSQNQWYLGRLAIAAKHFPLKKLIDYQMEFLKTFEQILNHPNDQESIMRNLAVRCLS